MNQFDFLWRLPPGRALRLPPVAVERRIAVMSGRLWLTREDDPVDHWLCPGEGFVLAAGEAAVIEAGPAASFQVLLPQALTKKGVLRAAFKEAWA